MVLYPLAWTNRRPDLAAFYDKLWDRTSGAFLYPWMALVFDDIRANQQEQITWLMQGRTVETLDMEEGRYRFRGEDQSYIDMQLVSTASYLVEVKNSTADNRKSPLGWKQLQAQMTTSSVRIASVYGAWEDDVNVTLEEHGTDQATITVSGPGFVDTWEWTAAESDKSPGRFVLESTTGQEFNATLLEVARSISGLQYRMGDWMTSYWFGEFYGDYYPWLYHVDLEWQYAWGDGEGSLYLWDPDVQWRWTHRNLFPWAWEYADSQWVHLGAEQP